MNIYLILAIICQIAAIILFGIGRQKARDKSTGEVSKKVEESRDTVLTEIAKVDSQMISANTALASIDENTAGIQENVSDMAEAVTDLSKRDKEERFEKVFSIVDYKNKLAYLHLRF